MVVLARDEAEHGGRRAEAEAGDLAHRLSLAAPSRSEHWEAPETFRLDRAYANRAYLPFGLGPRACVGMGLAMLEMQLIALEFAAAYSFGRVTPFPAPQPTASVTLVPPAMRIEIEIRSTAQARASAA